MSDLPAGWRERYEAKPGITDGWLTKNNEPGKFLYEGTEPHTCGKPMVRHLDDSGWTRPPVDTVWQCSCGRIWQVRPYAGQSDEWRPISQKSARRFLEKHGKLCVCEPTFG